MRAERNCQMHLRGLLYNSIHRSSRLWRGCSQTRTVEGGNLPSNFPGNFSGEQSEKRLNGCIAAREINQLRLAVLPPEQKVGGSNRTRRTAFRKSYFLAKRRAVKPRSTLGSYAGARQNIYTRADRPGTSSMTSMYSQRPGRQGVRLFRRTGARGSEQS